MQVRKTLAAVMAAAVCGSVAQAAPAQAAPPGPWSVQRVDTVKCPCRYSDPYDGTYFKYDKNGLAVKIVLRKNGKYFGKVEFHPNDEELWVYDLRNDNDTFYVRWKANGDVDMVRPPSSSNTVDKRRYDLNIEEGQTVTLEVFDRSHGEGLMGETAGVA